MDEHTYEAHCHQSALLRALPSRTAKRLLKEFRGISSDESSRVWPVATSVLYRLIACFLVPPTVIAGDGFDALVISDSGKYVVEYLTHPSPIPMNRMFEMTVSVRQRLKKSLAQNITLQVDAGMSEHNHGMNTMPMVERLPNRQFRVRGMLFHMAGRWELTFLIKRGIMVDKAEQVLQIQ